MKYNLNSLIVVGLIAVLAGCSSKGGTKDDVAVEEGTSADGGAVTTGVGAGGSFSDYSLNDPNSPLSRRVIYFEYDSAEITSSDQELLVQHAGYLVANPGQHITLEGNTDERGSREYNIALGERRADAVKRLMAAEGAAPGQLSTVSYGEERPAALGTGEEAMSLNRRVEIRY